MIKTRFTLMLAVMLVTGINFQVWANGSSQQIQMLIDSLRALKGAQFIRNGSTHGVDEAINHMVNKWKWKQNKIKSAEDFIRIAGTKSSITGKYYLIKMKNGKTVRLADWFRQQLQKQKKLK